MIVRRLWSRLAQGDRPELQLHRALLLYRLIHCHSEIHAGRVDYGVPTTHGFPTSLHRQAAEAIRDFFVSRAEVDTVLLVNSCARGRAVPGSDLDLAVLVTPAVTDRAVRGLEASWSEFRNAQPLLAEFQRSGRFTKVHLDLFDGRFTPTVWDDGGGPGAFEIEIGNRVAWSVPLHDAGDKFQRLRARWLPYYEEDLRLRRLAMAREACAYDLEYLRSCLDRELYFQAFDRLYKAFQEFLQALFIARKVYPLAYNKWIREQVADRLGLPEVYRELGPILSIGNLESRETAAKADALQALLVRLTG